MPSEVPSGREGGGAEPRGIQTCAFDIVLMPEGNGDMETILVKKSVVYTVRRKNFESQHG